MRDWPHFVWKLRIYISALVGLNLFLTIFLRASVNDIIALSCQSIDDMCFRRLANTSLRAPVQWRAAIDGGLILAGSGVSAN